MGSDQRLPDLEGNFPPQAWVKEMLQQHIRNLLPGIDIDSAVFKVRMSDGSLRKWEVGPITWTGFEKGTLADTFAREEEKLKPDPAPRTLADVDDLYVKRKKK